jgi:putative addiction module killer protein
VFELVHYQEESGKYPFREWMATLRDTKAKARIVARLGQTEAGNFGDCKPVGEGVTELRVDVGAGYRVYCGRYGEHWVILLCGGDKSTQARDISRAKTYWADWKRRQL